MYVIKRDGSRVFYDPQKVIDAINKAFIEVDGILYETDTAEDIALEIEKMIEKSNSDISVETIQNCIEDFLMRSERRDVARAYIRFRYKREIAREQKDVFFKAISEKLQAKNVQNQNANVDEHSFGGRMGEATDVMTKQYALDYCMSKMAKDNHLNNEIYTHDLSHYAVGDHNCLSVPFDHLLANGFNTRQTDVRPAGSVNTAFQLVAVIFQLQSLQQFGGVSATHLDWTMVPYVRKSFRKHLIDGMRFCENKSEYKLKRFEKWLQYTSEDGAIHFDNTEFKELHPEAWDYAMEITEREVRQAVEGLYHNLK